jgi:hypothetical protein
LINILLASLNKRFVKHASFIPMMRPPPTFTKVRSMLQWADRAMSNKDARPQVFTALSRPPDPALHPSSPAPRPPRGWRPSPNYHSKKPIYRPPQPPLQRSMPPTPASPPPPPPPSAPPASRSWRPMHDPWTGLVQAWSMPWSAPSPLSTPPAYSTTWQPGVRPHTSAPRLLAPRQPAHAYHSTPHTRPTGTYLHRHTMMEAATTLCLHAAAYTAVFLNTELGSSRLYPSHEQFFCTRKLRCGLDSDLGASSHMYASTFYYSWGWFFCTYSLCRSRPHTLSNQTTSSS